MVRYQTTSVPYKFRGQWMNVNPSTWGDRSRMICTVGTGTADTQAKLMDMQQLLGVQQALMTQDPLNPLCDYNKVHGTLKTMIELADLGEPDKYFYDPQSPEGQQYGQQKAQEGEQQRQEGQQKEQMQVQMQQQQLQAQQTVAQAEMGKAQATLQNGQLKAQVDQMKAQHASEIDALKAQLKMLTDSQDQDFKRMQLRANTALKLTELEVQANRDLSQQQKDNEDGKVESESAPQPSIQ
jgi:hypothetical protein